MCSSGSSAAVRGAAVGAVVGSGGHTSLVAVQQPQLGGSGSSTRSHGGWVRQRVAVVAVRQPQLGVQNPNGRPEQVIKAFRSPVLIKRMNQTHHRGSPRAQNGSSSNFVLSSYASLEDFNPKESVRSATIHTSLDTFHLVIQTLNQSIAY